MLQSLWPQETRGVDYGGRGNGGLGNASLYEAQNLLEEILFLETIFWKHRIVDF